MKPPAPAVASVLPSGLKTAERTQVVYLRVACSCPLSAFHSLIVLSSLALASALPSGLKATEWTHFPCPLRVACSCPVPTSHTLTTLSKPALARALPSG